MTMITLNGTRHEIADGTTLDQLVALFETLHDPIRVATSLQMLDQDRQSGWIRLRGVH